MNSPAAPALTTQFASPERLSGEEVAAQVAVLDAGGRVRKLIDAVPGLVALLNAERQVLLVNATWMDLARLLGKTSVAGMRPGEFLSCQWAFTSEGGCGTTEACRSCGAARAILGAQAGQRTVEECHIATVLRTNHDFRVTASPFEWEGRTYVLLILSDISDEKRRLVLEKIFFHDMLNTAGSVSGIAALIAEDPATYFELKDDLLKASQTLVNEIKSQRMLLAAENNMLRPENDLVLVRRALENVRQVYRNHPAARDRQVEIDPEGGDCVVSTDPAILQRVLGNMVKNALEASPPGAIVWLGADTNAERCTFWCQNGGEIPREAALQVFQRSFTTKGAGRGVGTYSMKLLGERVLGGTVSFTTSAEEGTRFQISLPRVQ